MTDDTRSESSLFADLTQLFTAMRQAPYGELEQKIEERFREFVRASATGPGAGLQVTLTLTLPDGADDWALYSTEYRTLTPVLSAERRRAAAGAGADVILFPMAAQPRLAAATGETAEVIAFSRS